MIGYLEGKIIDKSDRYIILNVGGVGYKVFVTPDTLSACLEQKEISLKVYTAVRENAIDLYGFLSAEEKSFFELLLDVSGVGPKSALSILGLASTDALKRAIASGDLNYLNKVSGIGRKTAEKIIVELRDKLKIYKSEEGQLGLDRDENDIIEALKSLGYTQNQARDALKKVPSSIEGTNARIKEALKILSNR
jgi:holliday junction DNA helicase RuvA